jgi:hypothetical protein
VAAINKQVASYTEPLCSKKKKKTLSHSLDPFYIQQEASSPFAV